MNYRNPLRCRAASGLFQVARVEPMAGLVASPGLSLPEPAEESEIFLIFRAARGLFHLNQVIQGGKPDERPAEFGLDLVPPDSLESRPFHKGMDIRLDNVLPHKQL